VLRILTLTIGSTVPSMVMYSTNEESPVIVVVFTTLFLLVTISIILGICENWKNNLTAEGGD